MERLLVTGVDTLLGSNLAMTLADRCQVLGLYDRWVVEADGVATACWHPDDPHSLSAHFEAWQPHWVLHCGPLAASNWEPAPDAARAAAEVNSVRRLSELCDHAHATLTLLSSDAVFSGPRMFHDERWTASANTPRAASIVAMEQALTARESLIVRTHAYGWNIDGPPLSFAERAVQQLRTGRTPLADGRRYATPILASDLAELLWRAYETRLRGLYHLAGAERTSAHRFISELAASLGLAGPPVLPHEPHDPAGHEETSLSSKRARRMLAAATPLLREGLNRFVAQRPARWRTLGPLAAELAA